MLLTAAELSVHYSQAPGCTTANLMNKPFRSGLPSTPKVDSKLTDSVWDKMDGIRYTNISVLGRAILECLTDKVYSKRNIRPKF